MISKYLTVYLRVEHSDFISLHSMHIQSIPLDSSATDSSVYSYPISLKFNLILSIGVLIYPKTELTTMLQPVRETESNSTILHQDPTWILLPNIYLVFASSRFFRVGGITFMFSNE